MFVQQKLADCVQIFGIVDHDRHNMCTLSSIGRLAARSFCFKVFSAVASGGHADELD